MRYKLTSSDNSMSFELRSGTPMVVGRAPTSDIPVFDPTISRRHAEVECIDGGVRVRDLGSSNGTFLNGNRVDATPVATGDTITFGKVAFKLVQAATPTLQAAVAAAPPLPLGATIVRQIPVRHATPITVGSIPDDKSREKLATLLQA